MEERTNLQKELDKKGISTRTLAKVIGASSDKTAWSKVNRKTGFYLSEAKIIKDALFPEYDMDYLFDGYDQLTAEAAAG